MFPRVTTLLLPLLLLLGHTALSQDTTNYAVDSTETVTADTTETVAAPAEPFRLRTLPDTLVSRLKKDPAYAYANDPDYWRKEPEEKTAPRTNTFLIRLLKLLFSDGFRYTLYIVLGSLLAYAIYRIMRDNNVRLFYQSSRKRKGPDGSDGPDSETPLDLNRQLQHYMQLQDYRQATRYLYLISLSLLNEKGLIRWHPEATNHEYILQLSGSAWENSFRYLTGLYEKVWYGEFPLGETQFNRLQVYFDNFYKTVPA